MCANTNKIMVVYGSKKCHHLIKLNDHELELLNQAALLAICANDKDQELEDALIKGADPNALVYSNHKPGVSLLGYAIITGKPKYIEILLEYGVDLNDDHHYLYGGVVNCLLTKSLAFDHVTIDGIDIIQYMLENGADATGIYLTNNINKIDLLLEYGADIDEEVNDPNRYGNALSFAVQSNNIVLVRELLERGTDPNYVYNFGGGTALDDVDGNYDMYKLLFEYGADPNIRDCYNRSAFSNIITTYYADYKRLIDLFLSVDATLLESDENKFTPLLMSILYGRYENALYLLECGCNVNVTDDGHNNPLHILFKGLGNGGSVQNLPIVINLEVELLKSAVNINVKNLAGDTPLHCLCVARINNRHRLRILHGMLPYYPHVSIKNNEGKTALNIYETSYNDGYKYSVDGDIALTTLNKLKGLVGKLTKPAKK